MHGERVRLLAQENGRISPLRSPGDKPGGSLEDQIGVFENVTGRPAQLITLARMRIGHDDQPWVKGGEREQRGSETVIDFSLNGQHTGFWGRHRPWRGGCRW